MSEPAEVVESVSMDDTLNAAFDAIETRERVSDQPRDNGKFVASEPTQEVNQEPESPVAAPVVPPVATTTAPQAWPDELKPEFSKLPPEIQTKLMAYEAKREEGIQTKLNETQGARQVAEAFFKVAGPHMDFIRAEGGDPISAAGQLFGIARQMRVDPKGTLLNLARQFNVDLGNTTEGEPQPQSQVPPELQQRLNTVEQRLQQQQHEGLKQQINSEIQAFSKDPANKHFAKVQAKMSELIASGEVAGLKPAYELAVLRNPEIQTEIAKEAEDKRLAEAKAKADAAAKAAKVNVKSNGAMRGSPSAKSMEDTMRSVYDRMNP